MMKLYHHYREASSAILWMRDTLIKALGLKPQSKKEDNSDDPQG